MEADLRSLEAFSEFREDAAANGIKYFLEVFNPNVDVEIAPGESSAQFVNDNLARCLSGVLKSQASAIPEISVQRTEGSRGAGRL